MPGQCTAVFDHSRCERQEGHPGPHQVGNVALPNPDDSTLRALSVSPVPGPWRDGVFTVSSEDYVFASPDGHYRWAVTRDRLMGGFEITYTRLSFKFSIRVCEEDDSALLSAMWVAKAVAEKYREATVQHVL